MDHNGVMGMRRWGEAFDDVEKDIKGCGSLEGEGSRQMGETKAKPGAEGYVVTFTCEQCGVRNSVTMTWPEVIWLAHSALPSMWIVENGRARPDAGCGNPSCRFPITMSVTPDECQRWVNAGIQAGFVSTQVVQQLGLQANQAMAAHGRPTHPQPGMHPPGMVRRR